MYYSTAVWLVKHLFVKSYDWGSCVVFVGAVCGDSFLGLLLLAYDRWLSWRYYTWQICFIYVIYNTRVIHNTHFNFMQNQFCNEQQHYQDYLHVTPIYRHFPTKDNWIMGFIGDYIGIVRAISRLLWSFTGWIYWNC